MTHTIKNQTRLVGSAFLVKPTKTTPYVSLDYQRKKLVIKGRSAPIVSVEFYNKILSQVDHFLSRNENLTVFIALEYFNTSSSKCIYNLLKGLKHYRTCNKKNVVINWLYEVDDEDMKETGEDYMNVLGFEFNMQCYTY